jgi:hypothetical protein
MRVLVTSQAAPLGAVLVPLSLEHRLAGVELDSGLFVARGGASP